MWRVSSLADDCSVWRFNGSCLFRWICPAKCRARIARIYIYQSGCVLVIRLYCRPRPRLFRHVFISPLIHLLSSLSLSLFTLSLTFLDIRIPHAFSWNLTNLVDRCTMDLATASKRRSDRSAKSWTFVLDVHQVRRWIIVIIFPPIEQIKNHTKGRNSLLGLRPRKLESWS